MAEPAQGIRRLALGVLCFVLFPTLASAQTWTAEQQEVWKCSGSAPGALGKAQ